eukprot:scaffold111469_cov35-Tisochrysis_lutea.AAC.2
MPVIGTTPAGAGPEGAAGLGMVTGAAPAGAAALARAAFSTSAATMRPSGPVPITVARSTPLPSARERAKGEATMRPLAGGAATGAAAGAAATGAGAAIGAGAAFGASPAAIKTSSSVTRPKLPVPGMSCHFRPFDLASFLAAGVAILFGEM